MDEKTDEVVAATVNSKLGLEEGSAEITPDPEPEELLPVDEGVEEPSEATGEESNVVDASLISNEINEDLVENNLNSDDVSAAEVHISENNAEMLSADDKITTASENSEDTNTNVFMKESENEAMTPTEPMEIDKPEEKLEQIQQIDTNSVVYQLEEELKRLHGGDTSEEAKTDTFISNLSVTSILEDKIDSTLKKDNLENTSNALMHVRKLEEDKPIMKDSDLEEMLSADDVIRDPILIKGML